MKNYIVYRVYSERNGNCHKTDGTKFFELCSQENITLEQALKLKNLFISTDGFELMPQQDWNLLTKLESKPLHSFKPETRFYVKVLEVIKEFTTINEAVTYAERFEADVKPIKGKEYTQDEIQVMFDDGDLVVL